MLKRKNNRLKGFDYSQNGVYFITICASDMKCILSDIISEIPNVTETTVGTDNPQTNVWADEPQKTAGADDSGSPKDSPKTVGADDPGSPKGNPKISPKVQLTPIGKIVENNILLMDNIYPDVKAVRFVIMPNHLHILLEIQKESMSDGGAPRSSPPTNTLSKYVTALKKFTSKQIGYNIWQRSYYDHIIRSDEDYLYHIQYIEENPRKWIIGKDEYYS